MSKRRSKSSGNIVAIIFLLFILLILSNCGKSISDNDRSATQSVLKTNSAQNQTEFWETYHAHVTSVQETVEMDRVIATVTAIYKRTIRPTLIYEATHEKFVEKLKQQQTVEAYLTEISQP